MISGETVQSAFDAAADALLIESDEGVILHANAAALNVIQAEGAGDVRLIDLVTPEYQDEWQRLRKRVAAGESVRWTLEMIGLRGRHRWMEMHAAPLRNPDGTSGLMAVCRDHTAGALRAEKERDGIRGAAQRSGLVDHEAEAAVSQARLAALVESCDDAIIGKSIDGVITSWNRSAERLFGHTAAEAIGRSILIIVPPDRRDEESMILSRLWRGERIDHFETQRMTKDGRLVDISITVSPIRDHRGVIVGASKVARDIGEKRRLDQARERILEAERFAREQAQKSSLVKDEFLATLSHELRTPLAAIQAWGHLLAIGRVKPEEMRQAGEVIERNANVQKRVIEDLLDIGRIVSGKLRLDFEIIDPIPVMQAALDTVAPAALAKNIHIRRVIGASPMVVRGDPARLQQVMWNLLSNAIKFTPNGGEVSAKLESLDANLRLTISDNGIGIEPAFLPRVFDRFAQSDISESRTHGGLGLGLAIAKQLTEMHGGSIRAHSEGNGRGASFILDLPSHRVGTPARDDTNEQASWASQLNDADSTNLSEISVLVVDDDPDARQAVERILKEAGADVSTVESAAAALTLIDRSVPDVLVSDIGLPQMDGYELLRRIRAMTGRAAALPAIALTAFARPKDRLGALRAGYAAHLAKPADPTQLIATVAAIANRGAFQRA
ncbi:MAG TPA: PAS domain S-box protein [Steroidobacteraceae bacterium]